MKRLYLLLILLIPLLILSQQLDYTVDKPSELYIGTPFHLKVSIFKEPGDSVFTSVIDTIDIFQVLNIQQADEIVNDKPVDKIDIKLAAFDAGEFTFPPLEFTVKNKDQIRILTTSSFQVIVKSVLQDSSNVIKDIAKPVAVKLTWLDYLVPVLILILLFTGIYYLKRFLKRMKSGAVEIPEDVDTRPAYVIALEKLTLLKQKNLPEKSEYIEFYYELSMILRFFIERYYKVQAVEMTTSEIRANLQLKDHTEKRAILELLTKSDMVKFAKHIPKNSECGQSIDWSFNYFRKFEKEYFAKSEQLEKKQSDENNPAESGITKSEPADGGNNA